MNLRWKEGLLASLLAVGMLAGCQNDVDEPEVDEDIDRSEENDQQPQTEEDGLDPADEKGEDLEFDKDRGPD